LFVCRHHNSKGYKWILRNSEHRIADWILERWVEVGGRGWG